MSFNNGSFVAMLINFIATTSKLNLSDCCGVLIVTKADLYLNRESFKPWGFYVNLTLKQNNIYQNLSIHNNL